MAVEMNAPVENIPTPAAEYCLWWIDSWATCMTKAEWSGWMQAVGAVVAILIAIAVPALQHRASLEQERLRAKDAEARDLEICGAIVKRVIEDLLASIERFERDSGDPNKMEAFARFTVPQLTGLAARMKAVPVHILASASNTENWLMMIHKLEITAEVITMKRVTTQILTLVLNMARDTKVELDAHVANLRGVRVLPTSSTTQ